MNVNNIGRVLISFIVVAGFMTVTLIFITAKASGTQPNDVVTVLVGVLGTNFTQVVSYWIGSSSGSMAKDEQLSKTAEKLAEKASPPNHVPPSGSGTVRPVRWANLTNAEKPPIAEAGASDTRIARFMVDSQNGGASYEEVDYLVSKGFLTPDRAEEIKKAGIAV